jgi:arsenate reductase-like glutaredoxin family protein
MKPSNKSSTPGAPSEPELIDKKELRRRLNLPSVRMVEELMRKRKIPYVRLGHRTVRFSWAKVLAAIAALEHRSITG